MNEEPKKYNADTVPESQVIMRFVTSRSQISIGCGKLRAALIVWAYNRKHPDRTATFKPRKGDDYREMHFKIFYNIKKIDRKKLIHN